MCARTRDQLTSQVVDQLIYQELGEAIENFVTDRKSRGLSPRTIRWYVDELGLFAGYAGAQGVKRVGDITPSLIRNFLLDLSERRNQGGCHSAYRTVKAFLRWFDDEYEPDWRNPIKKVRPPEVVVRPLPGIEVDSVRALIEACNTDQGPRDKALFLFLYDTGIRASELTALTLADIDLKTGATTIESGKGRRRRRVFAGKLTMRELRRYLRTRTSLSPEDHLFTTGDEEQLTYWGLRQIVRRRSEDAGIEAPGLHDFRRACALQCLRNGMDLITVSRLLGHSSLTVTQRYICQDDSDLAQAHDAASPVDNLG